MYFYRSPSHDPRRNLAIEQFLFDHADRRESYFYLWQNENTIVVGRFQNTAGEINADVVRERGITVVRRLSGGGAVYHDLGNLNFTFITDAQESERICFERFCTPVLRTIRSFGVEAELSGRNDITVAGAKISGNAQYLRGGRVMHHGTILFDSDFTALSAALRVEREKLAAKGVRSVRSRVTNLREHLPAEVTREEFCRRLVQEVAKTEPLTTLTLSQPALARIEQIQRERYDRWEWNWGQSPGYTDLRRRRIEGVGTVEAAMELRHERITALCFRGDFFAAGELSPLQQRLLGCRCRKEEIAARLADFPVEEYICALSAEELTALLCD